MQWVRRALTVPPRCSPYLLNDGGGSGRISLALLEPAAAEGGGSGAAASCGGNGATETLERQDVDVVFGHGSFRGLRLWMVLRAYGADGLRRLMRHRLRLQGYLEQQVSRVRWRLLPCAAGPLCGDAPLCTLPLTSAPCTPAHPCPPGGG